MSWHPAKAWTSRLPVDGYRHFERVMQGGRGPQRWVELAPVLAPGQRRRVAWAELRNPDLWESGWQQIPESDAASAAE